MKIIRLNKRHLDILAQIDFESKHQMEEHFKKNTYLKMLEKRFKKRHELFFGFKENGIMQGYVTLKPFFPGHKHCEVYWLSVRKQFQGKGIGTRLMDFIENYAKKQGFRRICMYTNKIMKKTRKFYEKRGYKLINEFPGYYGYPRNNTAVLYAKNI